MGAAFQDELDGAYVTGKKIGLVPKAIARDIQRAKFAHLKSGIDSLRDEVNACLGDYYGRPND